jgi:hypothetical protein
MLMARAELSAVLRSMAEAVERGESPNGSITYDCVDERTRPDEYDIIAAYRTAGGGAVRFP